MQDENKGPLVQNYLKFRERDSRTVNQARILLLSVTAQVECCEDSPSYACTYAKNIRGHCQSAQTWWNFPAHLLPSLPFVELFHILHLSHCQSRSFICPKISILYVRKAFLLVSSCWSWELAVSWLFRVHHKSGWMEGSFFSWTPWWVWGSRNEGQTGDEHNCSV